jgi:hypothetical protein
MEGKMKVVCTTHSQLAWVITCLLMLGGVAQSQKVTVDYNKKADFSQYKTYSWIPLDQAKHPMLALDLVGAVDQELQARGLRKLDTGGDLIVHGFGSLSEGMNVSYDVDIYAAPGLDAPINWENGTPRPGNSTAVYVDKGTLVVDIADRKTKQLLWRGIAKAELDPEQKEKSFEIAEKAVAKMFKQYPSSK